MALAAARAEACASCGSGGGDPLVLYPNERFKAYLGASRSQDRRSLTVDGRVGQALGPTAQEALVLAVGAALPIRGFVTLTGSLLRNSAGASDHVGLADPSLAVRTSLWLADRRRPLRPQVQLILGLRPGWARASTTASARRADLLDRLGDGAWERRAGVDVWWETGRLVAGAATFVLAPGRLRLAGGGSTQGGATWRTVATVGWDVAGRFRWLLTAVVDRQADRRLDGQLQPSTGRRALNLATTLERSLGAGQTLRLTLGRAGLSSSRLALRDVSVGLALMRAW